MFISFAYSIHHCSETLVPKNVKSYFLINSKSRSIDQSNRTGKKNSNEKVLVMVNGDLKTVNLFTQVFEKE